MCVLLKTKLSFLLYLWPFMSYNTYIYSALHTHLCIQTCYFLDSYIFYLFNWTILVCLHSFSSFSENPFGLNAGKHEYFCEWTIPSPPGLSISSYRRGTLAVLFKEESFIWEDWPRCNSWCRSQQTRAMGYTR